MFFFFLVFGFYEFSCCWVRAEEEAEEGWRGFGFCSKKWECVGTKEGGQCKRRWQRSLIDYCGLVCLFLGGPDFMGRMRAGLHGRMPTTTVDDRYEHRRRSIDGGSSISSITTTISTADGLLISEQMLLLGDGDTSSFRHNTQVAEDALVSSSSTSTSTSSSSDGSSPPLGWPLGRADHPSGEPSPSSSELNRSRDPFMWEQKREKRQTVLSGTITTNTFASQKC